MLEQGFHGKLNDYDDSGENEDLRESLPESKVNRSSRKGKSNRGGKSGKGGDGGRNAPNLYDLMINHKCDKNCKDDAFHANRKRMLEESGRYPYHYESGIAGLHKMHKEDNTFVDKRMDRIIQHYQKKKDLKDIKTENI